MDKRLHDAPVTSGRFEADWSGVEDSRRASARRAAMRHSRLVRILKVAIPGAGALLFAGVVVMIAITNYLSGLGFGKISLTADGLVMDQPELSGHDGKQSYRVAATRAIQRISDPRIFDLETIVAELKVDPDQRVAISAANGTYDSQAETLRLSGGISVSTNDGHSAELERLFVDLDEGSLKTDDPISIATSHGTLTATRMRFDQHDNSLVFSDGISMTLQPPAKETE